MLLISAFKLYYYMLCEYIWFFIREWIKLLQLYHSIVLLLRFMVMRTIFIFSVVSRNEIFLSHEILFYDPIKTSEPFRCLKLRMWFHVTLSKFFFIFLRWEKVVNKTLQVLLQLKLNPGKLISLSYGIAFSLFCYFSR